MFSGAPPAVSMNSRRLRNIASACSSGLGDNTPVLASLPEIAEEKIMLPMTTPLGIGAPCSMPLIWIVLRFAIARLPRIQTLGIHNMRDAGRSTLRETEIFIDNSIKFLGRIDVHPMAGIWHRVEFCARRVLANGGKILVLNKARQAAANETSRFVKTVQDGGSFDQLIVICSQRIQPDAPLKFAVTVSHKILDHKFPKRRIGNRRTQPCFSFAVSF